MGESKDSSEHLQPPRRCAEEVWQNVESDEKPDRKIICSDDWPLLLVNNNALLKSFSATQLWPPRKLSNPVAHLKSIMLI